ncbi:hypothetical protein FQP90_19735 [Paenarthrobacter nitroguajacolicus]|uniref:Uncharacterized protein n=1 Tax=Paenarthrobacter nitroguajacolicus TaxID=211146 RepID=A0A558GQ93_PAENT|nr:hypothetical protein [Paenarthrobacter nitroguajacolicus]TVU59054.1 hypothetical protein FQP90_19735 [Paenarthrobacter nitroguajacolicus]
MQPLMLMGILLAAAVLWVGVTLTMLTALDHKQRRAKTKWRHFAHHVVEHPTRFPGRRQTQLITRRHTHRRRASTVQ